MKWNKMKAAIKEQLPLHLMGFPAISADTNLWSICFAVLCDQIQWDDDGFSDLWNTWNW